MFSVSVQVEAAGAKLTFLPAGRMAVLLPVDAQPAARLPPATETNLPTVFDPIGCQATNRILATLRRRFAFEPVRNPGQAGANLDSRPAPPRLSFGPG